MSTRTRSWPFLRTATLLCLFAISLLIPQRQTALAAGIACSDGIALWATSRTQSDGFSIAGSNNSVNGGIRSNADFRISGSNSRLSGPLSYVRSFEDGGDANSYPTPIRTGASNPAWSYDLASYRPGGTAAAAAQAVNRYRYIDGDLDLAEPQTLNGLYYVTGNAKLSASQLRGNLTIVAEGEIDVSGSLQDLRPYSGGLLLFSARNAPGSAVIKLAGSNSTLHGVVYAPAGMVEFSGGNLTLAGIVLGDSLKLSSSDLQISFGSQYCPANPPAPDNQAYAADQVVLKLFNAADLEAVALANGLHPQPLDQFGSRAIYQMQITDGTDPLIKAEQLHPASGIGGDPRVEYAEPNYYTQDPESRGSRASWVYGSADAGSYAEQWAPETIRLAEAHTVSEGQNVTVAVLDTGVDTQHPALKQRLTRGFDFVDFDSDPAEVGNQLDNPGYGHGTHVAGLIALAAPAARIMPVRVLDPNGLGNVWVLSEGLLYAVERGPDGILFNGDEPQVVNLSLGTLRQTRLLEDLLAAVTCTSDDDDDDDDGDDVGTTDADDEQHCRASRGVVVIAAAGNGGDSVKQYPAAENVAGSLAVAASTRADTLASFSTSGDWVRLAAPGEQIISTVPGGAYAVWSGSSMAAPLTAGVAALLRSAEPALSSEQVTNRLVVTGRPISGPVAQRLDAAAALGIPFLPAIGGSNGRGHSVFLPMIR